jgi:small GTP-binding protein
MITRVLTSDQQTVLAEERDALARLQTTLARFEADRPDQDALSQSIRQLDDLFLLVVVGEFNSGKSTFINALLGQAVLEEGVTPTTTEVQRLTYGPEAAQVLSETAVRTITVPLDLLRDIHIVDTPGTNAIFREHEAITTDFVPRADLVLFVTSADRPFTETERGFMDAIRDWGKKIVIVINKVDILERSDEVASVERFVRERATALLGVTPEIFAVSSRAALRAKASGGAPEAGGFAALETYIVTTLDERERVRLKLLNPIGVGGRMVDRYGEVVGSRLDLLKDDVSAIADVEAQLSLYREDMGRDFRHRLSTVDNVLHEFERRGVAFFDEMLRVGRVFDLLNKSKLQGDFERQVVGDMPKQIERGVDEIIDWMVGSDLRQWQGVMSRIQARKTAHADRLIGDVNSHFEFDRARLLETVGRAAERAVDGYDRQREAAEMAESVRTAVAGAALAEAGAIGLGAAVAALASTTFADVTGILAASALAVVGLFVIPVRRRQAKAMLREKIEKMRTDLMASLTGQFDREIDRGVQRVQESIAPYTRFVRSERERLTEIREELSAVGRQLASLQDRIRA